MSNPAAKRILDIVLSSAGLVLFSPVFVAAALAVVLDSRGPILFRHERVGQAGRKFKLLKFRTMRHRTAGADVTTAADPRITRAGRVLRRTKADELPQLWNVLVGDMSMVGPRPEVERYVAMFADDYREILTLRPGITDFAAIEYRHEERLLAAAPDPELEYCRVVLPAKIALYHRYVAEQSVGTDIAILARTVATILVRA